MEFIIYWWYIAIFNVSHFIWFLYAGSRGGWGDIADGIAESFTNLARFIIWIIVTLAMWLIYAIVT